LVLGFHRIIHASITRRRGGRFCNALLAGAATALLVIGLFPGAAPAQTASANPIKAFSIYWENDSVTGSDQDYSNGLKLTWSRPYLTRGHPGPGLKALAFSRLPFMRNTAAQRATSFSIGQFIYTPKETDRSDLIVNDRPYAGYSFLSFGFISITEKVRHFWEFDLGVVGPWSLAENTQNGFHDLIRTHRAAGWDHQLNNEIGLEAVYEVKWQSGSTRSVRGLGVDVIPHLGFQIGNIASSAKVGVEMRFGWSIPRDFGSCPIRAGCEAGLAVGNEHYAGTPGKSKFGFHFFAAAEGRAVLRDIFLDGNTFGGSHQVDKEIYVAEVMGGIAVNYGRFKASYAMVLRSPEFKERRDRHAFGTINMSYSY
jgi:lipid A 3-O-deacylase